MERSSQSTNKNAACGEIDRTLMEKIQEFFGGIGYISPRANNNLAVEFRVSTLNDIANVIIPPAFGA